MRARSKIRTESTVFLLTLFGILVFANLLGVRFFARGDLTKDDIFSLSDASIKLVDKLDDKLLVKAYFTKNLPGRYATLERSVRDLLEEYRQHSHGKLALEFIDPAGDEKEEEVAKSLGIQKMPNPDIEKDQATVKEGYRGIAFSFGDKTEVIPAVESPVGLEYEVTSTIKKLVGSRTELGFLVGHGEPEVSPPPDPNQQMPQDPSSRGAYRNIRNNLDVYEYSQVDLEQGKARIPSGVKAVVVAGAEQKLTDLELFQLDQFLLAGNALVFFVDGVKVDVQQPQYPGMPPQYSAKVNDPGLRAFLEHHGVTLGDRLLLDAQAADFPARCPPIPLPLPRPYPAWPIATAFGEEHSITFRLGSMTLPYATSVRVTKAAREDAKRKAREIAFSSGNTWTMEASKAVVDPCRIEVPESLESSIPLAAAVEGTFTSFFKGKELPQPPADEKAEGGEPPFKPDPAAFLESSKIPGRLVVVGSAGLPADETISLLARLDRRQALNNFTFVQNTLDWATNEADLIAVRMKTVDDPPLEKASEGVKAAAKYGNIIGIPLALVLFGVIRWRVRRSAKDNGGKA